MGDGFFIRPLGGDEQPDLYEISIRNRDTLAKITGMSAVLLDDFPIGSCAAIYDPVSKSIAPEFSGNAAFEDGQIERAIYSRYCQEAEAEIRADYERRHNAAMPRC